MSEAMRRYLLLLALIWGYDEAEGEWRLMTYCPVSKTQKIHVILRDRGAGLPEVTRYPTAQAARAAWATLRKE